MIELWEADRRAAETFRRLHRLMRKGYVLESREGQTEGPVLLRHVSNGPDLLLYPNGTLAALGGRTLRPEGGEDHDRLFNRSEEDVEAFERYLDGLRDPTWLQRTRPARIRFFWQYAWIYLLGLSLIVAAFVIGRASVV